MRYDWKRSRCGRTNRAMRWVLGSMAVASWPLFASDALRDHDWTLVLPVLLITGGAGMHNVMTRKIYGVSEPEPQFRPNFAPKEPSGGMTPPDGRTPLDLERPYPRPAGGRRKLDKTCPVCGTGAETGETGSAPRLTAKVLGWPAHASCAEWLGDWKPPSPEMAELQRHLDAFKAEHGDTWPADFPAPVTQQGTTNTIHYTGGTVATVNWMGGAGGNSSSADLTAMTEMLRNGMISMAELRDNVTAAFSVPGPDLGDTQTLRRKACPDCGMEFTGTPADIGRSLGAHRLSGQCGQRHGKQAPVIREWCTCGREFTGTAADIAQFRVAHQKSGMCPHAARYRDPGPTGGA